MKRLGLLGLCIVLGGFLAALMWPTSAGASFHLTKISEIYASGDSQFIELQMHAAGQNFVNGVSVTVHDATGATVDTLTFSSNVANGTNQRRILLATSAAEAQFGVAPDLQMDPSIVPAGGKVCFSSIDCVAWGNYTGPPGSGGTAVGTPYDAANGLPTGMSIVRDVGGGTNPSQLEGADDTNDSAADFDAATPTPTNNANQGSSGSPSPTPSVTQSPTPTPSPCSPAVAFITKPADSEAYPPRKVRTLKGFVQCDESQVEVALVKKMKGGKCHWWDGGGFAPGPCATKVFNPALAGDQWSFGLGTKLKPSIGTKIRHYTAYARATDLLTGTVETTFEKGRNANTFEVK
jgi:hypothetical protein